MAHLSLFAEGGKEMLSLAEAAPIAKRSVQGLGFAIRRGDLPALKFGKTWIVSRHDLQQWIDDPEKHTRGVKAKN